MQLRKVYPRNDPRGIRPSNCSGTLGGAGARPLPARRSLDALRPPTATTSSRAQTSRTGTVLRHSHGRPVGRIVPPDACGSLAGGSRNASTACPRWRPLQRRSARGDWVHDRRLRAKGWGFGVQRKRQKSTPVMVSSSAVAGPVTTTPAADESSQTCKRGREPTSGIEPETSFLPTISLPALWHPPVDPERNASNYGVVRFPGFRFCAWNVNSSPLAGHSRVRLKRARTLLRQDAGPRITGADAALTRCPPPACPYLGPPLRFRLLPS